MYRTRVILIVVFGLPALVLGIVAASLFFDARGFQRTALHAEGTVVDIVWHQSSSSRSGSGGRTAAPIVRFTVDGQTVDIRGRVWSKPPAYQLNDRVKVIYPPGAPAEGRIESFAELYLGAALCGGIGGAFGTASGILSLLLMRSVRRRRRAIAEGTLVQAKVIELRLDRSVRINGRSPWIIEAEHVDKVRDRTLRFSSYSMWDDPRERFAVGADVSVYYLPDEPDVYAFDLAPTN